MVKTKTKQASARKQSGSKASRSANAIWAIPRSVQRAGNTSLTSFKTILVYPVGSTAYTGNAVSTAYGANSVALNSLTGNGNYTNIFDSYRIDMVEWTWTLRNNGTSNQFPTMVIYPDWDDATVPTSLGQVQSHTRAVSHTLTPSKPTAKLAIVPKIAVATYNGAFTGYGQNEKPMWIDSSSSGVAHYGAKWAIWNFGDTTQNIDLSIKAWVSFREPI